MAKGRVSSVRRVSPWDRDNQALTFATLPPLHHAGSASKRPFPWWSCAVAFPGPQLSVNIPAASSPGQFHTSAPSAAVDCTPTWHTLTACQHCINYHIKHRCLTSSDLPLLLLAPKSCSETYKTTITKKTCVFGNIWHCWLSTSKRIWPLKTQWWGAGMVICLERGVNDFRVVQLMSLPPHYLLLH